MKVVNKEAATGHLKVTLCQELQSYDQKEIKLVSIFMKELDSNDILLFFLIFLNFSSKHDLASVLEGLGWNKFREIKRVQLIV